MRRTWSLLLAALALASLTAGPAAAQAPEPSILNLNTATRDQLIAFPGIGAAYADKIIQGRPFKQRSELVSRKIMPDRAYLAIKKWLVPTSEDKKAEEEAAKNVPPPPMFDDNGRINLNVASREQLLAIEGVEAMFADKIISGRPFKDLQDMINRINIPAEQAKRIGQRAFVQ
jgi:DNA uptake protein ComE-like DNA-binding protein